MTPLGGCVRCHPTLPPPLPKTLHRTKEEREKTKKCDLQPKSSQVLRVWHESSRWRSWMDPPEELCLLMAYLSLLSGTCAIRTGFVRAQGVPETRAGLRGITGNLDRRQNRGEKKQLRRGRKTTAPGLAPRLGPHRSPGTLAWKHSPLRVFNKCHLTLGEALVALPDLEEWGLALDLASWRGLSQHWQGASGISWLSACTGAFPLPHAALGQTVFFFSVGWVDLVWITKTSVKHR